MRAALREIHLGPGKPWQILSPRTATVTRDPVPVGPGMHSACLYQRLDGWRRLSLWTCLALDALDLGPLSTLNRCRPRPPSLALPGDALVWWLIHMLATTCRRSDQPPTSIHNVRSLLSPSNSNVPSPGRHTDRNRDPIRCLQGSAACPSIIMLCVILSNPEAWLALFWH